MIKKMSSKYQEGAVLVVSMILLVILTLYGLTASNSSLMEVAMTADNNDLELALNTAESGIQQAVLDINALVHKPDMSLAFGATDRGDFYSENDIEPDLSLDSTWDGTFKTRPLSPIYLIDSTVQKARYFIVYLGEGYEFSKSEAFRAPELKNMAEAGEKSTSYLFRIVSMGTGLGESSRRIVEAFYLRTFEKKEG